MSQTLLKLCPIHYQPDAGDPPRCLQCEPDECEARWMRKPLTAEDIDNLTDAQVELIENAISRAYAKDFVRNN